MTEEFPQEKVFVQTDRSWYVGGETIWMKAWCTLDGSPSFLSRILYVDIVNADGAVIGKKMYKLDSMASTPADFVIPYDLKSGNYRINAYTLWMLNFPDYVFSKDVFIYGSDYRMYAAK
ncbi:MAG TPA: MG2 domain-containing protein, partial [Chitinophagaceae bacterium]